MVVKAIAEKNLRAGITARSGILQEEAEEEQLTRIAEWCDASQRCSYWKVGINYEFGQTVQSVKSPMKHSMSG